MDLHFINSHIEPWMLAVVMVFTFVGSLVFVPWAIVRLPADYFHYHARRPVLWSTLHPVLRLVLLLGKNLFGCILIVMGLAMLVLPGQGLLTILIGILLLDFPGKFMFERWLISRKPILRTSNWLRKKAHKEPLWLD